MKQRAVFIDRDDTLIACNAVTPDGDLGDAALVELLPGAFEACARLKRGGYFIAVVSNQGGVARGKFTTREVESVNARLNELLGGTIDAFRYCPYHPRGVVAEFAREHPWRKPSPGMILDIAEKNSICLDRSWCVGDAERDVEAGRAAGCRTIRIGPAEMIADTSAEFRAADLPAAAMVILRESNPPS
ncbi:MAG TPA: HAD-IIIA family hydrolase [Phycisphaerales bacterium]|nr:HAD-IIIA family hydrolase [Phycisphaerales bacterium]